MAACGERLLSYQAPKPETPERSNKGYNKNSPKYTVQNIPQVYRSPFVTDQSHQYVWNRRNLASAKSYLCVYFFRMFLVNSNVMRTQNLRLCRQGVCALKPWLNSFRYTRGVLTCREEEADNL